ncbi:PQQ-binding-like beta-propeller repeat protein [Tomitella fengzijianii]|uniref:PQQ-binding-like beta-propeller repeat protein n=1 Tax=Tomitella fengzijianii TaxID=2597660 RepID=A0A516X3V2_9ACTN|nr:PQQ-binding-like beta-propeller repeat protein [Tomitella fengzijianii]QDQ97762.1 PQQ-binding-like beta-propeller repeat protein [Tomitella fengzijianii]
MPLLSHRPALRAAVSAVGAAGVVLLAGACAGVAEPIPAYQDGWSAVHGQADGANAVQVDGPREPVLQWSRDLGAQPTGFAASGPDGQLIVSAHTDTGCQMFTFDLDTGRKQWCTWQNIGAGSMSPLVDQMAGVYTGNIGSADSFDVFGSVRWHTPVIGTPRPLQFLADRAVLAVTHLGQVNVLSTITGRKLAPSVALAPADWPPPPDEGLEDCATAGPGCPVAFPPAVDTRSDDFFFPFRAPGTDGAALVAMHYAPGAGNGADINRDNSDADADGSITELWRSQPLPGGVSSAPALSPNGDTVYVLDGNGTLWALGTDDGAPRWRIPLDLAAPSTVSVSPDGLVLAAPQRPAGTGTGIVPGVGAGADGRGEGAGAVIAVRDEDDTGRVAWQRPEIRATGPVAIAGNGLGYVVTGAGQGPAALSVLDLRDGRTVSTAPLAPATGTSGVVVVTNAGRIVVVGAGGLVSVFE